MNAINLLIVEDERIIALDLKSQLESLGYSVCKVVANGEDAYRAAQEFHPDLVLMDIHIEGPLDGIETARRIDESFAVPAVFLTAYSEDDNIRRAKNVRSFGYLVKPFERRELHATIQMAVERSRTESALRLSQNTLALEKSKLEAILSSIGEGLIVIDAQLHCILFNAEAQRVFGSGAQQLPLLNWSSAYSMTDAQGRILTAAESPFVRAAKGEAFMHSDINLRLNDDSPPQQLRVTSRPFFTADGSLLGGVVVFSDVTRERELDRIKDEFVSVASHELRTPMAAIKGISSMLLDGDYGPLADHLHEPIVDIHASTDRLIDLVNDLLDAHRLDTGTMVFTLKNLDLASLIREVLHELEPLAVRQNLSLTFKEPQTLLEPVLGDPARVREVLHNLLGNALKFTEHGSIEVSITDHDDQLIVMVSDTGIGIAASDQRKLFSKFQQITSQLKGKPAGTGLGLHIALTIVRRLGGELWLERSAPDKGSTFAFSLPKGRSELAHRVKKTQEITQRPT